MSRKFASCHRQKDYGVLPDRITDMFIGKVIPDLNPIGIEVFRWRICGYCTIKYDASTDSVGYLVKDIIHSPSYPMRFFTELAGKGNSDEHNKYMVYRFMGRGGRAPVFEDYTESVMNRNRLNKDPARFNKYI